MVTGAPACHSANPTPQTLHPKTYNKKLKAHKKKDPKPSKSMSILVLAPSQALICMDRLLELNPRVSRSKNQSKYGFWDLKPPKALLFGYSDPLGLNPRTSLR